MPSGFLPLLRAGRFTECRELAEKTLERVGHTMREAAQSHHAIACCDISAGDLPTGITAGERALELSLTAEDWDLTGTVLMDLAAAYNQVRRYRRQAGVLQQYMDLFHRLDKSRIHEVQARRGLGAVTFLLGEFGQATEYLNAALAAANQYENHQAADQCRHLLRQALIRSGRLEDIQPLLAETKRYLRDGHDESAACDYWYDYADFLLADGLPSPAFELASQAMLMAEGVLEREVECAVLLHQCVLRLERFQEAGSYLLLARLRALQADRLDLVYDVNQHLDRLISNHGPSVLDGMGIGGLIFCS